MPEVRSVLVFGGQILGGAAEVRKATLVVNLVHKSQREPSAEGGGNRDSQSDRRRAGYAVLVPARQRSARSAADRGRLGHDGDQRHREPDRERDGAAADDQESDLDRGARPAGAADRAARSDRCRSRGFDRGAVGYDPRCDLGRYRRQPGEVQRRRSADPDPGRAHPGRARATSNSSRHCALPPRPADRVPLAAVARVRACGRGPTAINRYDRTRRVTIEADLTGDAALGEAARGDLRVADRQEPAAGR